MSPRDAHRPLLRTEDVDRIFTWQEERTLSAKLTLNYRRGLYLIEPTPQTRMLGKRRCQVYEWEGGQVEIVCDGKSLPFRLFDKDPCVAQAAVVSNKRLGATFAFIQKRQQVRDEERLAHRQTTLRDKKRIRDKQLAAGLEP